MIFMVGDLKAEVLEHVDGSVVLLLGQVWAVCNQDNVIKIHERFDALGLQGTGNKASH